MKQEYDFNNPAQSNNYLFVEQQMATIISTFLSLTQEQRMNLIYKLSQHYCLECGKVLTSGECHCWNDE